MRRALLAVLLAGATFFLCSCGNAQPRAGLRGADEKIRVVIVTGGHGFDKAAFLGVFDAFADVKYVEAKQADDSEIFEDISKWDYDVIVLYNMGQKISPKRQENFVKLLKKGVGVVAMHHSIGAFQDWKTYPKIIGGKYYLRPMTEDGVMHEASKYKDNVKMEVKVEDQQHPITRGLKDFVITDETYKQCSFQRDNHVLLSTDAPTNDKPVCWVRKYGKSRICYFQFGHGPKAYGDSNFRILTARAIRWSAGRLN